MIKDKSIVDFHLRNNIERLELSECTTERQLVTILREAKSHILNDKNTSYELSEKLTSRFDDDSLQILAKECLGLFEEEKMDMRPLRLLEEYKLSSLLVVMASLFLITSFIIKMFTGSSLFSIGLAVHMVLAGLTLSGLYFLRMKFTQKTHDRLKKDSVIARHKLLNFLSTKIVTICDEVKNAS